MKSALATTFAVWSAFSTSVAPASAAEQSESQRRAAALSPFIDDRTLLVIGLTWPEPQIAECIEMLGALKPGAIEVSEIRSALAAATQNGVREAYIVGSLAYLPEHTPLLVVPIVGDLMEDKLVEMLKEQCEVAVVRNGCILAGDASKVASAQQAAQLVRPEISDAFEAVEGTALQILFLPTADQRAVLEVMLPHLPREVGGQHIMTVTRGCQWAALGLHVRPKKSLQLVVQSEDATSAHNFRKLWEKLVEIACRHPDVAGAMPPIDEPSRVLTPHQQNDRLLLDLDAEKEEITALSALLRAPAALARASANRAHSRQNLLTIGLRGAKILRWRPKRW